MFLQVYSWFEFDICNAKESSNVLNKLCLIVWKLYFLLVKGRALRNVRPGETTARRVDIH